MNEFGMHPLNLTGRLADNFYVAYDSVLIVKILLKGREIVVAPEIFGGTDDGLGHVFQVVFKTLRVRHRGSACRSTRSRNLADKNPGVSTETRTPSNASASFSRPASVSKVVASAGSTYRSRSLSSVSVPVKTDPKTRGLESP